MTLTPGDRLGPYEILAPLGAGGMGEVYRARDPRLGREVAIKVLPAEVVGDPERLQRFEQEARAASALNHPAILTVHDIGSEGSVPFLVTELLAGTTLRDRLRDGPLSPSRAVEVAAALARGLAAAHEKGIVHRDLKPENIFLTSDGAVKILDFGLARVDRPELADGDLHAASTVLETREGTVLGTVGYMAPEQVRGLRADARSDLFALGVVLHEMLAGLNPFRRDSVVESLNAILNEEPADLAATANSVDSALGRIVNRLLAKAPANRFQSARDLAFALDSLAPAARPSAPATTRRAAPRLLVATALALVITGAWWLYRSRTPAAAPAAAPLRSLAVLPLGNLSAEGANDFFADGMTDALTTELARLAELKVIASNSTARFKGSTLPPAQIARELDVEGLVVGSVVRSGQRARISAQLTEARSGRVLWAESYERDLRDVLSLQGEVARAIAQAIALELSPAEAGRLAARRPVDPRALDEYLAGRALWNRRTERDVRSALAHFQTATAIDPGFALGHTGIADAYIILAAYGGMPSLEAAPLALAAAQQAIALDPAAGEPHASRGDLAFHVDHDFDLAQRELDRAIELAPGYATAYHWRSEISIALDRIDEALDLLQRAIELDPYAASPRTDYGLALELAGRFEEAEQAYRFAAELSPSFRRPRVALMKLQLRTGRAAEALAAAREAELADPFPAWLTILGSALAATGENDEAQATLDRLRGVVSANGELLLALFRLEAELGDRAAARALLERAFARREFWVPLLAGRRYLTMEFPRLRGDAEVERFLATMRATG